MPELGESDVEQISRLKYAYLRHLDCKQWDELGTLLCEDATAAYSGGAYAFEGREAIIGFLRRNLGSETFHTSHRVHHPEIEVAGDEARAVWAMDDVNVDPSLDFYLSGAGFYEDRYRREADGWRISHTGYRRSFETVMAMSAARMALTASWWSTDARSTLEVQDS